MTLNSDQLKQEVSELHHCLKEVELVQRKMRSVAPDVYVRCSAHFSAIDLILADKLRDLRMRLENLENPREAELDRMAREIAKMSDVSDMIAAFEKTGLEGEELAAFLTRVGGFIKK